MNLDNISTLVLNADYRPLSFVPLSTWRWQDTITAVLSDKVTVVQEYEDVVIRSASLNVKLPSVIALKNYIHMDKTPKFTRYNIFCRDNFTCQYCGNVFPTNLLTFDHVVPLSRGGKTSWDNIVTSCTSCNSRKGNKMCNDIGMHPITYPAVPKLSSLMKNMKKNRYSNLHNSWVDYVYWDSDLTE